jgi:transcriptional regulator of acetoin/glycerol metabolism
MVALVAALVELLGRIIGEEMAVRLVDQTGIEVDQTGREREREKKKERERPSPRGVVSAESKGGRDAGVG